MLILFCPCTPPMDTNAIKWWTVVDVAHAITFQLRIKSFVSLCLSLVSHPSQWPQKKQKQEGIKYRGFQAGGQKGVADPPMPLAGFHRTWTSLLPLATARFDMLFQTSNNSNNSNNKKEKPRMGRLEDLFFSPGFLARACCIDVFAPTRFEEPISTTITHCARGTHESICQSPMLSTTNDQRPLFPPDPPAPSSPPFTRPNKQTNKTNHFIFFCFSSYCHFVFPAAQTNHRHSRFLAHGPQKRCQIRQNCQTKDMHQIQDPMQ